MAMVKPVTVWDGIKLFFMAEADAITAALAGTVQVWDGPRGYRPGYYMAEASEFPLAATPAPTLTLLTPDFAVQNTGDATVRLTGTGFTTDSEVRLDGVSVSSVYISATAIDVLIPTDEGVGLVGVLVRDAYQRETVELDFAVSAT